MRVTQIGVNSCHFEGYVKDFAGETDYYLLLFIKSRTIFKINGKWIHSEPNTIIIYNIGTPQYFCADGERFIHDWLTFIPDDGELDLLKQLGIAMDTVYQLHEAECFADLFKQIHAEFLSGNACKEKSISSYLHLFFYKLTECIHRQEGSANNYREQLQKIRAMIYDNPARRWSIQELADELNVSASYFQILYKKQFKVSPIADAINSRVEYSKYLLTSTDYSVNGIAKELNYSSDIQFIQQFKSVIGCTPSAYRNSFGKNKET